MPSRSALIREFRDEKYRNTYVDAFLDSSIAAQIRALRKARGLKQAQLANLIGTQQSGVSKLENVNYSRWSIRKLKDLAKAFDVALVVKFVSFGEALADIENFSKNALVKPTFAQDPTFLNIEAQTASAMTAVLAPVPEIPAHIRVRSHGSHTGTSYIQAGRTGGDLLTSPQV